MDPAVALFLDALVKLQNGPMDHLGKWEANAQYVSSGAIQDDLLYAEIHPTPKHRQLVILKPVDEGVKMTQILHQMDIPLEKKSHLETFCSNAGTLNLSLVALFPAKDHSKLLANPTKAWILAAGGFEPVTDLSQVVCRRQYPSYKQKDIHDH